jgi:hypothetical protein
VASKIEIQVPVERQKAAQAAGNFELADLPGRSQSPTPPSAWARPSSRTRP